MVRKKEKRKIKIIKLIYNTGLDDFGSEIAFAGEYSEMGVHSSNWEPDPILTPSYTTVTVLLTTYSENSSAFDISFESAWLPVSVHVTPSQIQIYTSGFKNDWARTKHAKFPRMQGSQYGHYWAIFSASEVSVGIGKEIGTYQIGKLVLTGNENNLVQQKGRVDFNCFKISGAMLCKISNIRILWE